MSNQKCAACGEPIILWFGALDHSYARSYDHQAQESQERK